MLVYEYMARGSLENHLFKSKSPLLNDCILNYKASLFLLEEYRLMESKEDNLSFSSTNCSNLSYNENGQTMSVVRIGKA